MGTDGGHHLHTRAQSNSAGTRPQQGDGPERPMGTQGQTRGLATRRRTALREAQGQLVLGLGWRSGVKCLPSLHEACVQPPAHQQQGRLVSVLSWSGHRCSSEQEQMQTFHRGRQPSPSPGSSGPGPWSLSHPGLFTPHPRAAPGISHSSPEAVSFHLASGLSAPTVLAAL